jgi:hypothetical protein
VKKWIALSLLLPTAALAKTVTLGGPVDVAQATTCGASTGQGTVSATLDDQTGQMSWNVTFGNNAPNFNNGSLAPANETLAHFHGPAPPGLTAGVQITLPLGSPKIGSQVLTATQVNDVKAGLWYVNIHSNLCGGGELRGQLSVISSVPTAAPWITLAVLLAVGSVAGVRLLRRRSTA